MGLGDLFRNKLEYTEVVPSESFGPVLMKRLARKEFLHFIPGRFNIWYLGCIVAAGVALAFILVSEPGAKIKNQPVNPVDTTSGTNINVTGNAVSDIPSAVSAENDKNTAAPVRKNRIFKKDAVAPQTNKPPVNEREIAAPRNITGNINGKDIINSQIEGKDRLQSGNKIFTSRILPSVSNGCMPLKVLFKSDAGPESTVRWEFGDGGSSEAREPQWIFDIPGEYEVKLQVTSKDGIIAASSALITVHPRPVARFEISPEEAVIPDDEIIFHNFSSGAIKYSWDFGDGATSELYEPRHKFSRFGNYNLNLVATSEYGCTDTISLRNAFAGKGYYIDFPNAFIPNPEGPSGGYYSQKSDENARVFHPTFAGVSEYQLKIFTRLGILIFETDDISLGWDGYFKGQLCEPGVYIWKVRGSYINGEFFTRMGDITLLKSHYQLKYLKLSHSIHQRFQGIHIFNPVVH